MTDVRIATPGAGPIGPTLMGTLINSGVAAHGQVDPNEALHAELA